MFFSLPGRKLGLEGNFPFSFLHYPPFAPSQTEIWVKRADEKKGSYVVINLYAPAKMSQAVFLNCKVGWWQTASKTKFNHGNIVHQRQQSVPTDSHVNRQLIANPRSLSSNFGTQWNSRILFGCHWLAGICLCHAAIQSVDAASYNVRIFMKCALDT